MKITLKNPFKNNRFIGRFIIVYVLFWCSILISILHTEHVFFHVFILNKYIFEKVFIEAFKNTVFMLLTSRCLDYLIYRLISKNKRDPHSKQKEDLLLANDILANIIVIVLFSITFLPLYTIIIASYIQSDGTFLRLAFVHFETSMKIASSVSIVSFFLIYFYKKYKPDFKTLVTVFFILATPCVINIFTTQSKNFHTVEMKISQIGNTKLFGSGEIVDPKLGIQMEPLAQHLVDSAHTDSERSKAYAWMADAQLTLGNFEKAFEYNNKSLEINDYSASSYHTRSYIYRSLLKFDDAITAANRCAEIAYTNEDTLNEARCESEIALGYEFKGIQTDKYKDESDFIKAQDHIQKAIELDPEQIFYQSALTELLVSRSLYYFHQGQYDKALPILNELIAKHDTFKNGYLLSKEYGMRADIKSSTNDHEGAIADLKKSLEIFPDDDFFAYVDIGGSYASLNQYHEAINFYQKAIDINALNNQSILNKDIMIYMCSTFAQINKPENTFRLDLKEKCSQSN